MLLSIITTMSFPVFAVASESLNIVNNGDMESGTDWWHANGGKSISSVSEEKHSGSSCILSTGRSNPWQGVAQNITGNGKDTPVAGNTYDGSAWVMFKGEASPQTVTFKLSIKRNNGTEDKYDNIASVSVPKGEWTLIEGSYKIPEDTDLSKDFNIYIETDETEAYIDFYADDVNLSPQGSSSSEKIVALTFDDGPDNALTALVLDKLDKYEVPATFFMVGSKINDSTKDTVKRVVDSGHEIGNHSWSYSDMANMTKEEILTSVNNTTAEIEKYSGKKPLFFRPPNLSTSPVMFEAIDLTFASGIVGYDWDQTKTAEDRAKSVLDSVKDGSIILLHDVQPLPHPTPEALDIIIPKLLEDGYKFVTLSELFRTKGVELSPTDNKMYVTVSGSTPSAPNKDIVKNGNMESGKDGWYNRGSASIEATSEVKHGGESSLFVTGRQSGWQGPAQNLVDPDAGEPVLGKSYKGSAWVMYNGEEAPASVTFKLSVQWNDGTSDHYDQVSQIVVNKGQWTLLEGDYVISESAVADSGIHLYVETTESAVPYVDFYMDDVSFSKPQDTVSFNGSDSLFSDFEKGESDDWANRGEETVTVTDEASNNGTYSILAKGRTQAWNGPKHTLMGIINLDKSYQFSGYVMYKDGPDTQTFNLSVQKDNADGTQYINVGSATVSKGKWTLIEGEYTVPNDPSISDMAVYFETPGNGTDELVDFYVDDIKVTGGDSLDFDPELISLKSVWDKYFPVGAAITPQMVDSPVYSAFIKKHFATLTAENVMKPEGIQPTEGQFTFDNSDKLVDFAQKNNLLIRAHTLVWHSQTPEWFFTDPEDSTKPATREKLIERMKTHIETFMTRYNGKFHTYDVVNEVISDNVGLRDSKWRTIVGDVDGDGIDDDYIIEAFKIAYETAKKLGDDKVLFCINDYSIESSSKKLDTMYNTVKRILDSGIPKERLVVGFQMHISSYSPSIEQLRRSLMKFTDLGVKVQVTELDISIYQSSSEPKKAATEDVLQLQAKRYKDVFDLFKELSEKGIMDTVTLWGTDDGMSWLNDFPVENRTDAALLFNKRLQPKPAFTALTTPDALPVYKNQITAFKGTPASSNDKLWNTIVPVEVNQFVTGSEGATAKIKTMWDSNNLYIIAQVDDKTPSQNDSFEVFFDTDSSTTKVDKKYMFKNISLGANGYLAQIIIPISDLKPAQGNKLSIDFRVNDYKDYVLNSVAVWNDYKNQLDKDASGLGNVLLGKESKLIETVYGTAVVDGKAESLWNSAKEATTSVWVSGTSGSTAKFKTMWDEKNLYVIAEVTDSLLSKKSADAYQQDSVEIFVDQDNGKTTYYDADDNQIRVNFDNEISYNPAEYAGFVSATSITETGFIVEAAIPITAVKAQEGAVLGFDLQVNNDEDDDGSRDSVSIWCDPSGLSYKDFSGLGNIILVKGSSGFTPGDINGDNSINSTDLAMLKRTILGILTLDENAKKAADMNSDGSIDSTDLALLKRIILESY